MDVLVAAIVCLAAQCTNQQAYSYRNDQVDLKSSKYLQRIE